MPVCGKCHQNQTVAEIRMCYQVGGATWPSAQVVTPESFNRDLVASPVTLSGADDAHECPWCERYCCVSTDHETSCRAYGIEMAAPVEREIQNSASPAQVKFIRDLYNQIDGSGDMRDLSRLDRKVASELINDLKIDAASSTFKPKFATGDPAKRFMAADYPHVTEGFYAVILPDTEDVRFFKVDVPDEDSKWHGRLFVAQVLGGGHGEMDRNYVRIAASLAKTWLDLLKDEASAQAAKILFGQKIGCCGECGRELTNEESIAAGIGPICAAKGGY